MFYKFPLIATLLASAFAQAQEPASLVAGPRRSNGPHPEASSGASSTALQYHGGPVITGLPPVYIVWYGTTSSSTMSILTDLVRGLTHTSYANIATTYQDSTGAAASNAWVLESAAYDLEYSHGKTLTQSSQTDILFAQFRSGKLPVSAHAIYFVVMAPDVVYDAIDQDCGYHEFTYAGSTPIRFAVIGNGRNDACNWNNYVAGAGSPNNNPRADAMASTLTHELMEMITDPYLNAWYISTPYGPEEGGDLCNHVAGGALYRTPNGSKANIRLGGRDFLLQQMWVNLPHGGYCSMGI